MFEDSAEPHKLIILNIEKDIIKIILDSTKTKENKNGDALEITIDKKVLSKYNAHSITFEENYLKDRVKLREKELGINH